jgi:hypothetical protein
LCTISTTAVDAFPAAQFGDGHLASKPFQDNANFLLGGMLASCLATDILNRLFSVGHAHNETPLLQLKAAELSLSESAPFVLYALTAHKVRI